MASWLRSTAVTLGDMQGLHWPGPGSLLPAAVLPRGTQDGAEAEWKLPPAARDRAESRGLARLVAGVTLAMPVSTHAALSRPAEHHGGLWSIWATELQKHKTHAAKIHG